jgi:hypothetical protein
MATASRTLLPLSLVGTATIRPHRRPRLLWPLAQRQRRQQQRLAAAPLWTRSSGSCNGEAAAAAEAAVGGSALLAVRGLQRGGALQLLLLLVAVVVRLRRCQRPTRSGSSVRAFMLRRRQLRRVAPHLMGEGSVAAAVAAGIGD